MMLFSAHRVTKSFDARWRCERRFYEYLMPTFMFAELKVSPRPKRQHHNRDHKARVTGPNKRGWKNGSSSSSQPPSSFSTNLSSSRPSIQTTKPALASISAVEAKDVTVCLRGLHESWRRQEFWHEQQRSQDVANSPTLKNVAPGISAGSATSLDSSSSNNGNDNSSIATSAAHQVDGLQTGVRIRQYEDFS